MLQLALEAFAAFFVTVAPLNAAPLFAALTAGVEPAQRRLMAVKGAVIAAVALLAFGIVGDDLLRVLGITLPAVRVGGGILLMRSAIDTVTGGHPEPPPGGPAAASTLGPPRGVAVFPLAIPIIAGPATITAVVVLMGVLLIALALLLMAGTLERIFGKTGMSAVTRVLGILLMALAAEFVLEGVRGSGVFR